MGEPQNKIPYKTSIVVHSFFVNQENVGFIKIRIPKHGVSCHPQVVVMEVVIFSLGGRQETKTGPGRWFGKPTAAGEGIAVRLQQAEFFSAANGRLAIIDPKLAVNVFGMSAQGVERNREFARNFRPVQIRGEQPQHFEFTVG